MAKCEPVRRGARARRTTMVVAVLAGLLTPVIGVSPSLAQPVCGPGDFPLALSVDSANPSGASTPCALEAFATYRVHASGEYDYFTPTGGLDRADAECSTHASERVDVFGLNVPTAQPGWQARRYAVFGPEFLGHDPLMTARTDAWDPDPLVDYLSLYIDNRSVLWVPENPGAVNPAWNDQRAIVGPGCSTTHDYWTLFTPPRTRPVNFRVLDLWYADNNGSLDVIVERVAPSPFESPPGKHIETVLVHSFDTAGTTTAAPLEDGKAYLLVAHGMYHYQSADFSEGWMADAVCSRVDLIERRDPFWVRDRYGALEPNALELFVGDEPADWRPVVPTDPVHDCDAVAHFYAVVHTDGGDLPDGRLRFRVNDPFFASDNRGSLSVEVFELPQVSIPPLPPLPPVPPLPPLPPVPPLPEPFPVCVSSGGEDVVCVPPPPPTVPDPGVLPVCVRAGEEEIVCVSGD